MKIKPAPKVSRKQKAYLKWMGLEKPKPLYRLGQLNKANRLAKRSISSEFVRMARAVEAMKEVA